jgi:1,4-dihydroxy-2-naphthoate octaprenyltransferase
MNRWVLGSRPRTLPAAVVPVAVGTAVAAQDGDVVPWRALAALVVAVAIQVGTNYANDYHDGVRGTDDDRVGPTRLVASGLASAPSVKRAALAAFAVAALAGLALTVAVGWELLVVGGASFLAGWFYTGGDRPYGYRGLGEIFVFVFFGLVATVGSTYVQTESITGFSVAASLPVGLLATALLVINNLRDIPTDAATGKRTLAVALGDRRTRLLYVAMIAGVFLFVVALAFVHVGAAIALAGLALAARPVGQVMAGAVGPELIPVLADTGRLQLVTGLLLAGGLALTA